MKKAFALVLFLGIIACVYSDTCPPEEEISPCTCDEEDVDDVITVSCYDSETTQDGLKKALSSLKGLKSVDLELEELDLGTLPSNFFEGLPIRKLEMSHCELEDLTDGTGPALKGLENSLEELIILSSLTDIQLDLGHLQKLKEIDFSFNKITELGNDWFASGPASLTELMISNNGIEKIGDSAFSKLNNLKVLSLDGNRFGPLKRSILPSSPVQLHKLELDNNDLTEIPDDLFQRMPSLKSLSLRTNRMSKLDEKTWQPVYGQLQTIYLEGNPLNCDSSMDWVFKQRERKGIFGKCFSPKEREGTHLRDLIGKS